MPLHAVEVVLVRTRFPENIGMAARACANMGCSRLCLVAPERWEIEKARPLATPKGLPVLEATRVVPTLAEAVAGSSLVMGTTARLGGWRQSVLSVIRILYNHKNFIPQPVKNFPILFRKNRHYTYT